nr:estradiol 17-beta-dehydrogenase 1 isoform X2 [Manis javanica]
MDRTVVLITGCSSGIGLHLALRLASDPSQSFKVYATLRDLNTQGLLWEAAWSRRCPPGSLETLQLDVRDAGSIAAARERVTEGRVDVLGLPFNAVYCASKFALEGLCESLAVLLPPFGVHVSIIECGPVRTAFQEKLEGGALDATDPETRDLFRRYQRHCERIYREAAQDPEEVTEVFLTALRAPKPALRYFSTERFLPLARLRLDDPSGCSYVTAMHRTVFNDEAAEGPEGTPEEAGAEELGGPELGAPPAAPRPRWICSPCSIQEGHRKGEGPRWHESLRQGTYVQSCSFAPLCESVYVCVCVCVYMHALTRSPLGAGGRDDEKDKV